MFVVDKAHLVIQQAKEFVNHTGNKFKVGEVSGDRNSNRKWDDLRKEYDVIVIIHQV